MEFNINKNATLPILKMELINDGRNDYHEFFNKVQDSNITFSMTNVITGIKKIGKKAASLSLKLPQSDCVGEEYHITYQFNDNETNIAGRYIGYFNIEFLDGSGILIVPIKENLFINVLDGNIKK